MRYAAWLAAIALNAFVVTWVTGVNVLWAPAGAFPGSWLMYVIPPALAVASLLWQRSTQSFVWRATLVANMVLSTWLVIRFAAVLPRADAYLWGYAEAITALPSMLAVIALVWPRERSPRRLAVVR
jgi:hypothetical protein